MFQSNFLCATGSLCPLSSPFMRLVELADGSKPFISLFHLHLIDLCHAHHEYEPYGFVSDVLPALLPWAPHCKII